MQCPIDSNVAAWRKTIFFPDDTEEIKDIEKRLTYLEEKIKKIEKTLNFNITNNTGDMA